MLTVSTTVYRLVYGLVPGDHAGQAPRFHIHIAVKHNPPARPNRAINPERTDYGPLGPTPTSATIVPHHLPTQLNRSAALRSLP